jgi:hypothetical protein
MNIKHPYAIQSYVNKLCSQKILDSIVSTQIENERQLNAEQNSIEMALISHVRIYKLNHAQSNMRSGNKKTGSRLTFCHLCSSISTNI